MQYMAGKLNRECNDNSEKNQVSRAAMFTDKGIEDCGLFALAEDAAKLASVLVTDEYGVKELLDNPGQATLAYENNEKNLEEKK